MSHPGSPQMSPRKGGKYVAAKVYMLDDTAQIFHIPVKALGYVLFEGVVRKLQLLEADYFDLEFTDHDGNPCWLDHEKLIVKQLSPQDMQLRFLVKFYTPDPGLLEEEYTRYLFALQVRRDIATGTMPCQEHTAVLLCSFIVQSEVGDYVEDNVDCSYLSNLKLLPQQTRDIEYKIMEHHKEHVGQTPAEADFNLLDTARKIELYGLRMHFAKDHEGVNLNLAVAHMGVLVFQGITKINTFSWAKIRKLSFKRKKFLIKLHPEGYNFYKDTVEFYFETRNECKNFWKKCIEHHAFFRCQSVKRLARNRTRVVSKGSSFRYSGRTQKQLTEYVRENFTKRPPFERSTSMRTVSSTMRSQGGQRTPNMGTLNSKDYNYTHNTSASSGSHTLEMNTTRDTIDGYAHRHEQSEGHDDSSQSGSRSINSPKKERELHATSSSEDHLHRADSLDRDDTHGHNQIKGGALDDFNYNYYKISYDMSHLSALSQNANDNDDNVSHDSYHLREESADELEQSADELDADEAVPKVFETVLHIDEEKLMQDVNQCSALDPNDNTEIHPTISTTCQFKETDIDHVLNSNNYESNQANNIGDNIVKNEQEKVFNRTPSVDQPPNHYSCLSRSESEGNDSTANERVNGVERVSSNMNERGNVNEISYVLHRRHVDSLDHSSRPSRSQAKENFSKQVSHNDSRDKVRLQFEQIKTDLRTPIQQSTKRPRDKSPGSGLVRINKLPPRDSYSCIDDTVSPSSENAIAQINVYPKHKHPEEEEIVKVEQIHSAAPPVNPSTQNDLNKPTPPKKKKVPTATLR